MIFTERTITVVNDSATINKPLILYRGDKNIELKITIAESQFKFRNTDASNVIETTDASYAQLVINTPYNSPIFSDVAVTKNGAVIFVITEAMIDEIREVGAYEIQIRLLDDNKQSRASIPPVSNAIEIREPIAIEDGSTVDSNAVNVAKVNRALTTTSAPLEAFDSQGNYIKKTWGDGDPITDAALNKMEAAIDGVNKKIGNNRSQIKEIANELPYSHIANNDYCFGFENLKRFYNTDEPIVTIYGDSIVAGTGSNGNNSWVEQLRNNLAIQFGLKGHGFKQFEPISGETEYSRWGICNLMINNINNTDIILDIPLQTRATTNKIKILYGCDVDGSEMEIRLISSTGTLLNTVNCNSTKKEIKSIEVEVGQFKNICLHPTNGTGKIYYNGVIAEYKDKKGSKLNSVCYGGHGLNMYSDSDLLSTAKHFSDSDLFIFEMGTNDYHAIEINEWIRRAEIICDELKTNNVDILFMVVGTNPEQESDETYNNTWKKAKIDLAKKYNGAYLDIDMLWGGYTNGNRNGLYSDTIHPSVKGHNSIAYEINSRLCKTLYNYYDNMVVNNQNIYLAQVHGLYGIYTTDAITVNRQYIFPEEVFFAKMYVHNGADWGKAQIMCGGNTAQRPNSPVQFMTYMDTTLNKIIWWNGSKWIDSMGNDV